MFLKIGCEATLNLMKMKIARGKALISHYNLLVGNQVIDDVDGYVREIRKALNRDTDDNDSNGPQKVIEQGSGTG